MSNRPSRSSERPNIILICVDQWRGDCLSIAGHPVVHTPYLDQLALGGARFARAYTACRPDEGMPFGVLAVSGLLADQHQRRAPCALPHDRLRGALPQIAGAAGLDGGAELGVCRPLRDRRRRSIGHGAHLVPDLPWR